MPVSSVHPHTHNTLPQRTNVYTNTFPTQFQIVSRDVTLKVQKGLQGCCRQETSQFSIVNTPGEMFPLSLFVWFFLRNLHLTHTAEKLTCLVQRSGIHHRKRNETEAKDKWFVFLFFLWSKSLYWPVFSDLILWSSLVPGIKAAAWCSGGTWAWSSLIWPWE